jgi:hypothetical protein
MREIIPPRVRDILFYKMKKYADLHGNMKNQGIKSPWDNNVMCLLADEELFAAPIESVARLDQEWRDIGYYTGPDGKKHFGSIPTRQKIIKKELGEGWM